LVVDLASQIVFWTFELMLVGRLSRLAAADGPGSGMQDGAQAIVAVGSVQLVLLLTITLLLTLVVGSLVPINRLLGAGRREEADHYFGQAAVWALIASVLVLGAWRLGAAPLSRLLIAANSGPARLMMADYLRTLALFSPLMLLNFVLLGILRGVGDGRWSMTVNITVNGLHLAGAFLLIFGLAGFPALGVRGSALAGGIAHSLGALLTLALILSGRCRLRLRREDLWGIAPSTTGRLVRRGLPMTVEQLTWGLGMAFLLGVATRLGTHSAAAHISLLSLLRISSLIFTGLGIAAMTIVGQHHGAGREDLAWAASRRLLRMSLGAAAILAALFLAIPGPLIRLFTPDPEVVELGGSVLTLLALLQIPKAVSYISAYSLRGDGDTKYPMQVIVAGVLLLELGLGTALALPVGLGLGGIWLAGLIDETARAYLVTRRLRRRMSDRPLPEREPAEAEPLRRARGA